MINFDDDGSIKTVLEGLVQRWLFIQLSLNALKSYLYPSLSIYLMQSYSVRALGRRLQVDWARDPREGPRVLMSLKVDFEPMG